MPVSFSVEAAKWATLYGALAGVSATMAGLLVASLTFNASLLKQPSLRQVAQQAFLNFSVLLLLSLNLLQPELRQRNLAATLVMLGTLSALRIVKTLVSWRRRDPRAPWARRLLLMSLGAYVLVAMVGVLIQKFGAEMLQLLLASLLILLIGSGRLCWELLLHDTSAATLDGANDGANDGAKEETPVA